MIYKNRVQKINIKPLHILGNKPIVRSEKFEGGGFNFKSYYSGGQLVRSSTLFSIPNSVLPAIEEGKEPSRSLKDEKIILFHSETSTPETPSPVTPPSSPVFHEVQSSPTNKELNLSQKAFCCKFCSIL